MILGIGVDVVEIPKIEAVLKRWEDRFLHRVFTEEEIQHCRLRKDPSPHFAVRFAAKEAFLKALGLGYTEGIRWKDIEIGRNSSGQPTVRVHNHIRDLCQQYGIKKIHVSMSHHGAYGVSQVLLEA